MLKLSLAVKKSLSFCSFSGGKVRIRWRLAVARRQGLFM